jgi:DNA modification methylase
MPTARRTWEGNDALRRLLVPVTELTPHPRNPRRGDVAVIQSSLERFGQQRPILALPDGTVVAGNHTLAAVLAAGWSHIAVIRSDLSDQEIEAYLVADNRTSDLGTYDDAQLADLLASLDDVSATGYAEDDLRSLLAELEWLGRVQHEAAPDAIPERPYDARSRAGEIYELGEHRLICGDATNADDLAAVMRDERAPLLFTSPPYLDAREYRGNPDLSPERLARFIPASCPHVEVAVVNLGILRRGGAVLPYWATYIEAAALVGWKLLSWNVWDRSEAGSIGQATAMFPIEHEWLLVFGAAPRRLNRTVPNKGAGDIAGLKVRQKDGSIRPTTGPARIASHRPLGSVVRLAPAKGAAEGSHPAVFPAALPAAYIEALTKPGETVLDPFAGSGTTLIAAEQRGRRACLVEIDPAYCDVIRQRYATFVGQPRYAPS